MKLYKLHSLWNIRGPSKNRKIIPVHVLLQDIGEDAALILPAMHSLTGCDSVSKIGTKSAALKCIPHIMDTCYPISGKHN